MIDLSCAPDGGLSRAQLDAIKTIAPGDVLYVTRTIKKKGEKPYDWNFFMVVTQARTYMVKGVVLNEKQHEVQIPFTDPANKVRLMAEAEWPDGVHAFRTTFILTGRVDLS